MVALLGGLGLVACAPDRGPPTAAGAAVSAGSAAGAAVGGARARAAATLATVTLITGDRVTLMPIAGGPSTVSVTPGPGRGHIAFYQSRGRRGGREVITVLPSDAAALVAANRLDGQLFDVSTLVRQGLDDGHAGRLGLIAMRTRAGPRALTSTAARAVAAAAPLALAHAQVGRALTSIGATALAVDKRDAAAFWSGLAGSGGARAFAPALATGVDKLWLDARAHVVLNESVPQIGAPAAWQLGLTGKGVTVAVLDTGIKADHPDLAGKIAAARDFTGTDPTAGDDFGHGTHVAGIIAGSGAASNGKYRGVAPDVTLLNGRVCQFDQCPASSIIAGMEWAAPLARVVSMSLGNPGDVNDPLAQAAEQLTAQYGTLFVVAAGNDGTPESVESPALADAALAVASVTKQDTMSDFSSRGPRPGDHGLKPDIAAPGSDIVSARAPGTLMGDSDPVDDNYVRISGTSMATPHVAAAAAILAQQHPDWRASELKAALMSTATRIAGAGVYDQGAGRVDVARAVTQPVYALAGGLGFGTFLWPHDQPPMTAVLTYRNDGDRPITLDLAITASGPDGAAIAGLFTVAEAQLTVPAHGRADAHVTAHPAASVAGADGGWLTATSGNVRVLTALGAFAEPPSFNLAVRRISRGSAPLRIPMTIVDLGSQTFTSLALDAQGQAVVRLLRGRYDVNGFDFVPDPADQGRLLSITLLSRPDIVLDHDVAVTFDARAGRPVRAVVDRRVTLTSADLGVQSVPSSEFGFNAQSVTLLSDVPLFALPAQAQPGRYYEFFYHPILNTIAPDNSRDRDAALYQLVFTQSGAIPERLEFRVHDHELARLDSVYHGLGVASEVLRFDQPAPASGVSSLFSPSRTQKLPARTTELYTAGDVTWNHVMQWTLTENQSTQFVILEGEVRHAPGVRHVEWSRAPLGTGFDGDGIRRQGDFLSFSGGVLSPSEPGHGERIFPGPRISGSTSIARDGVVFGSSGSAGSAFFTLPHDRGVYTLHTEGTSTLPWSLLGTRFDVTWTFTSEPPPDGGANQPPLLAVRAALPYVDALDVAPAGVPTLLELHVEGQPGQPPVDVAALALEVSYDDGRSWTWAPVRLHGDRGWALLRHPPGDGFVSLRVNARDRAGNAVAQTIVRAYQLGPMGPFDGP